MLKTAKLFLNGRSQALRLPAEFRFRAKQVYVSRDPETGNVILSERPQDAAQWFAMMDRHEIPADWTLERDTSVPAERDL